MIFKTQFPDHEGHNEASTRLNEYGFFFGNYYRPYLVGYIYINYNVVVSYFTLLILIL